MLTEGEACVTWQLKEPLRTIQAPDIITRSAQGGTQSFPMEHACCIDNLHETNIISICCWPGQRKFFSGSGNGQVQQLTYEGDLHWSQKLPVGGILSLDIWPKTR